MLDNTSKLKDLCQFNPTKSYYKFVCMIRWKDFKDNPDDMVLKAKEKQEIIVKQWLVDSEETLETLLPDMVKLTKLVNGRLYMCVDRKSTLKTLVQMRKQCDEYVEPFIYSDNASCSVRAINKIPASASSVPESSDKGTRKWLFDVDVDDTALVDYICSLCKLYESNTVVLKTVSGYHIVADRCFDTHNFGQKIVDEAYHQHKMAWIDKDNRALVDVKENAMTLIYTNL